MKNDRLLETVSIQNLNDYIEMKEAEREYERLEKPLEITAIEEYERKIDKIYNQAIRDLDRLVNNN